MDVLIESLQSEWAIRALIASSLVGITCGMIGCFIVLRNMSLIGDALSHAILPGVFFAFIIVGNIALGFFVGSVLAGLLTAFLITWIQHNVQTKSDAAVGIVFTAMFSIGVIGISWLNNKGGVHLDLKDFLFGNVLGVSDEDIFITAIITLITVASFFLFYRYLFITTFQPTIAQTMGVSVQTVHYFLMLLLSFAVVSALTTVGVILVVAMLITPASTALLLSDKLKQVIALSALAGLLSAVLGFLLAVVVELPPGPAMVIVATGIYVLAMVFAPNKGLIVRFLRKRKQKEKIDQEDIVRQAMKNPMGISLQKIADRLGFTTKKAKTYAYKMRREGLLAPGEPILLTLKGKELANQLIRAHRLWEVYQVNTMGLTEGQIHEEADRLEHYLTRAMVDEVDQKLGFPSIDPHGSPIPQKEIQPDFPLLALRPKSKGRIAPSQISDLVESDLWELGLLPNTNFTVSSIEAEHVVIKKEGKKIKIPAEIARKINIVP
jgi:ABC-type Mn2+/Zn2+ transport system permease subunit/Mn-dependent DtxR family transcriptional regulator